MFGCGQEERCLAVSRVGYFCSSYLLFQLLSQLIVGRCIGHSWQFLPSGEPNKQGWSVRLQGCRYSVFLLETAL